MGFQVCLCGEEAMARWDRERALLREVAVRKLAAGDIEVEPEYADPLRDSERADWCAGGGE